jgi:hypothetical protein
MDWCECYGVKECYELSKSAAGDIVLDSRRLDGFCCEI